jgi:N-methylhydantoinase A
MTRVGVDVGGTFTDVVAVADDGTLLVEKVLTTPDDQSRGFLQGVRAAAGTVAGLQEVVHGTTVGTNAVLERKGARTAFVTTRGFGDVLELQDQERTNIWDLAYEKAAPLVPRNLCFEVDERLDADGNVLRTLTSESLEELQAAVRSAGADSVAICLLHSYRNGSHEDAVAEALNNDSYVVASSALVPQFREYDRASTATMSAYIGPVLARYLDNLDAGLTADGFTGELLIMQSNGGVLPSREVARRAIGTVLSGPAGGVIAATVAGELAGLDHLISFDMGGTSTDVCLIPDRMPNVAPRSHISGLPVVSPMFRIDTVGAGGGSIAWVDDGGLLRVGPESAGSSPGPASYGRGGKLPTVTDALVVTGVLRGDRSFGGAVRLDVHAAREAMTSVAAAIGTSELDAAEAVIRLANHRMSDAVRAVSLNQGYDPRDFALVAFGGAGPLHAAWVADELDVGRVVVPLHAGVFSAVGVLSSDFRSDHVYSQLVALGELADHLLAERAAKLVERARREAGRAADGAAAIVQFDLRYEGQAHTLTVPYGDGEPVEPIRQRFHDAHSQRYGFRQEQVDVELVNVRVGLIRRRPRPRLAAAYEDGSGTRRGAIFIEGHEQPCTFVGRSAIGTHALPGPAVVEEQTATTFVPPGWRATADDAGQIHLIRATT